MPAKVTSHTPEPHPYDKVHEPPIHGKNWVHREALQIALGSILTPKRPYTPSRSTSGTLSPSSHTSGTGTPVHPHAGPHHHAYYNPSKLSQSSSGENSPVSGSSSPTPPRAQQPMSFAEADDAIRQRTYEPPPSPGLGPIDDSDPRLKSLRPTVYSLQGKVDLNSDSDATAILKQKEALAAAAAGAAATARVVPGQPTPRTKFMQTLQGKGAWDALIHGSFS